MAARAALILALLHSLLSLAAAQQTVNVAQGKPANASTQYSTYPASSVTDGNTTWSAQTCFHSHDNPPDNWLRVYLGNIFPMQNIRVFYRSDEFADRFVGTQINILNSTEGPPQLCTTVTSSSLDIATLSARFSCPQSGSIVELRKDGGTQNVCEVQVWVCPANMYGYPCTACGQCQGGAACASTDGSCPAGCDPGWTGQRCDMRCQAGRYGPGCTSQCGLCATPPCHHVTGSCPDGCRPGRAGELCTDECRDGSFGANCNSTCGSCYKDATCDHVTGSCPAGCQAGWRGPGCLQECRAGTYGEGCTLQCGHCAGGVFCDKEDGTCRTGCQEGLQPPLCQAEAVGTTSPAVPHGPTFAEGIGVGVGICLAVSGLLVGLAGAVLCVRRHQMQKNGGSGQRGEQNATRAASNPSYGNANPPQAELGVNGPYDSLEMSNRDSNVPNEYEKIGDHKS